MASLFQGSAMPDVNTTQTSATTAPDWYNNFLSGLSTSGQSAVTAGGVAGPSPLQQAAYTGAPSAINAGQPSMTAAQNAAMGVAGTSTADLMSQYENPYQAGVVNEINRLGQQQFQETLAPGAVSGAVGSGQFGSRRGMEVYGDVARDVNKNILGLQTSALQSGYDKALAAAQQQQKLGLDTATTLGNIGGQQYTQGVGGINVLSGLGAQQQATEQARLNYPMTAATQQAALLKGYTVPTSITQKYTGPMPGAYNTSPLAQVAGLTTGAASLFGSTGVSPIQGLYGAIGRDLMGRAVDAAGKVIPFGQPGSNAPNPNAPTGGTNTTPPNYGTNTGAGSYDSSSPSIDAYGASVPAGQSSSDGNFLTDGNGGWTPVSPDYSTYDPNNPDWGTM